MRTKLVTLALLSALLVSPAMTQGAPKKVVTIEGITEYQLENGLQVLLFPDQSRPTVTVNLTIFVGSRHEGYGEAGMAHLLEHMLFKGTPTHPDVPKVLQDRGAQFNGTTWVDRTNYYETLPASDENLEFAIALEADRMVNSFIKAEDLASEMTVVRNEFERGENSPTRVLMQRMTAAAYEWHNYGRSTIGNRSDIERVPVPKLRSFYRRHYQPDNAMLVVAGKFDEKKALEMIQKHFGSIPRPDRQIDRTYTEEPAQDGERLVSLRRVGDVGLVGVAYHIPAGAHQEFAAVDVLSYILATEPAGRLYKSLVETKKAAAVYGFTFAWHDPGLLFVATEVRDASTLESVRDALLKEIESIGQDGVSEEEVDRVKTQILKARELAQSNTSRLAIGLSEWAGQGDWRLYFLYRDRIEKVTAEDVQRVAKKYLTRNNRTVGMFIPTQEAERVAIPLASNVSDMVKDYQGRKAVAQGEQIDPNPLAIEKRTTRLELPSGLKVALLPKKTRGEAVLVNVTLRYGKAETLKGKDAPCALLPKLMARGTKQFTYQQLSDELDKQSATLSSSGSGGVATFAVKTKRANLPRVLEILKQVLREPTLPATELEVMRREQLASLESVQSDPQYQASSRMSQILRPYPVGDVRRSTSVSESIELFQAVKLADIRNLYDNFLNGQHGEITVVGDFDATEVTQSLNTLFDDWSRPEPYARLESLFFKVKGQHVTIKTPDKANATYYSGLNVAMSDDNPDYPAMLIGNFILGGGSLSSRLGNRVRQKDGLSYGIRSSFRASALDKTARFTIAAISNPENSPKVVAAVLEELELLLDKGITDEELARAKQGFLQSQQVARTSDGTIGTLLSQTLYTGRTMAYYAKRDKMITELTKDQVMAALRKYLDPQKLVVVTAGDFK